MEGARSILLADLSEGESLGAEGVGLDEEGASGGAEGVHVNGLSVGY